MKLASFEFELPKALIAQYPLKYREDSRLMIVDRKTQKITHGHFKDILKYFGEGDCCVFNDTKTFPACISGQKEKTDIKISVVLLRELNEEHFLWDAQIEPARKIRVGNKLYFGDHELLAEVIDNTTSRGRTIKFVFDGSREELIAILEELGVPSLPADLNRSAEPIDKERYGSIWGTKSRSVIPPVECLHFDKFIRKSLELKGVGQPMVTVHTGVPSIAMLNSEDLNKYRIESEQYEVTEESANVINQAISRNKRVCAIGPSVLKVIEDSLSSTNTIKPSSGWNNFFIHPPYKTRVARALIANFYLPKSAPLIVTAGFGGYDLIMKAYKEAVAEKYRFFVYGDAMLIL